MIYEALMAYTKELQRVSDAQRSWQTAVFIEAADETQRRSWAFRELAEKFQGAADAEAVRHWRVAKPA